MCLIDCVKVNLLSRLQHFLHASQSLFDAQKAAACHNWALAQQILATYEAMMTGLLPSGRITPLTTQQGPLPS
jgi:hypothetical protein